jgi:hypothetical protein
MHAGDSSAIRRSPAAARRAEEEIKAARVDYTIVGGKVLHEGK